MSVEYVAGDVLEYAYTGAVQTLTLKAGKYRMRGARMEDITVQPTVRAARGHIRAAS